MIRSTLDSAGRDALRSKRTATLCHAKFVALTVLLAVCILLALVFDGPMIDIKSASGHIIDPVPNTVSWFKRAPAPSYKEKYRAAKQDENYKQEQRKQQYDGLKEDARQSWSKGDYFSAAKHVDHAVALKSDIVGNMIPGYRQAKAAIRAPFTKTGESSQSLLHRRAIALTKRGDRNFWGSFDKNRQQEKHVQQHHARQGDYHEAQYKRESQLHNASPHEGRHDVVAVKHILDAFEHDFAKASTVAAGNQKALLMAAGSSLKNAFGRDKQGQQRRDVTFEEMTAGLLVRREPARSFADEMGHGIVVLDDDTASVGNVVAAKHKPLLSGSTIMQMFSRNSGQGQRNLNVRIDDVDDGVPLAKRSDFWDTFDRSIRRERSTQEHHFRQMQGHMVQYDHQKELHEQDPNAGHDTQALAHWGNAAAHELAETSNWLAAGQKSLLKATGSSLKQVFSRGERGRQRRDMGAASMALVRRAGVPALSKLGRSRSLGAMASHAVSSLQHVSSIRTGAASAAKAEANAASRGRTAVRGSRRAASPSPSLSPSPSPSRSPSMSRSPSPVRSSSSSGVGRYRHMSNGAKMGVASSAAAVAGMVLSNVQVSPPPITVVVKGKDGQGRGMRLNTHLGSGNVNGNVNLGKSASFNFDKSSNERMFGTAAAAA